MTTSCIADTGNVREMNHGENTGAVVDRSSQWSGLHVCMGGERLKYPRLWIRDEL
jgi:hypothetical protein